MKHATFEKNKVLQPSVEWPPVLVAVSEAKDYKDLERLGITVSVLRRAIAGALSDTKAKRLRKSEPNSPRESYPRANMRWTRREDDNLLQLQRGGMGSDEMAKIWGRQPTAISARLYMINKCKALTADVDGASLIGQVDE
jgi:hypothetical protein